MIFQDRALKTLVVIAHPLKDSLCQHLAAKTIEQLKSKGHQVTVKDLYQEQFNPVLSETERQSYFDDKFYDTHSHLDIEQLKDTQSLILIFPTWWFGLPAILKGWIDRVWAPGHAYDHADDYGPIKPLLDNLKEMKVITTLGAPRWVDYLVLRRPVMKALKYGVRGACAKNCSFKMLSLYGSESLTEKKIIKFVNKIEKAL